jgi:DNA-directed RNA polymerase subunit RPC12/RpoP
VSQESPEVHVPSTPASSATEIKCPHCKKTFSADLMAGGAERYRGFKCPHCRLFVPAARING